MPEPEKKEGGTPAEGNVSETIVVDVGGEQKTFKAEDVTNLLNQQAGVTQKTQEVAAIADAAKKYGLEPVDYVDLAENSFATFTKLMELGVINDKGEVIEVKPKAPVESTTVLPATPVKVANTKLDVVAEALSKIDQRMQGLEQDQTRIMRMSIERDLLSKHDALNKEDVSQVLSTAMTDTSKSVWQHAEDKVVEKAANGVSDRERYAKEFGIDVKVWDANKIKEQDSGGGAGAIITGKKISFRKPRTGETGETITPRQAMVEYFSKIDTGG